MSHMFEVMTPENTARVTMHNPVTGYSQTVLTSKTPNSIAYALLCFAKSQHIEPERVQYTTVYNIVPSVPSWAPAVGSTVKLHTNGKRKAPVPHTIESYSVSPNDGAWIFKAVDFAGWSHIDTVDALR